MTFEQGLQLCKQRRSIVDPIEAFCEQLQKYEQECRELGYLTAVNAQNDKSISSSNGDNGRDESAKKESSTSHIGTEIVCSKRKAEVSADADEVNKKRVVGPSIGPIRPSIGPSKPSKGPTDQSRGPA